MEALYPRTSSYLNYRTTYANKRALEAPNPGSGNLPFHINHNFSSGSDEVHFSGLNRAQMAANARGINRIKAQKQSATNQEASEIQNQITDIWDIYYDDKTRTRAWLEGQIIDRLSEHPKFDINTAIRPDRYDKNSPVAPLLYYAVSKQFFRLTDYILDRRDPDLTHFGPAFGYKKLCIAQVAKLSAAKSKKDYGEDSELTEECETYADKILKRQFDYEQYHPEKRTGYIRQNPNGELLLLDTSVRFIS